MRTSRRSGMRSKMIILSTAAVLAFAGAAASPGYARTHHRAHHMTSRSSTPAERAQTADLNRQQLQQAQTAGAGAGMAGGTTAGNTRTGNPDLSTSPTSYQRPGSAGMSGPASGTAGATAPAQDMAPAGTDTGATTTPGAPATPPASTDSSGGTQ